MLHDLAASCSSETGCFAIYSVSSGKHQLSTTELQSSGLVDDPSGTGCDSDLEVQSYAQVQTLPTTLRTGSGCLIPEYRSADRQVGDCLACLYCIYLFFFFLLQ